MIARIILAAIAGTILPVTIAIQLTPLPKTAAPSRFDAAWAAVPQQTAVLKRAEPAPRQIELVRSVVTQRIIPDLPPPLPPPPPPIMEEEIPPLPPSRPVIEPRTRDVCARHRMHKVMTKGGKSWRCVKGPHGRGR